jgi:hypothetical protein
LSRLDRKRGRFGPSYEVWHASDAMLDYQDVYGDWAYYYRYDASQSVMHPVYDEPMSQGRIFVGPIRLPVIRLVRSEGAPDYRDGGLYWTDGLHLTIPVEGLERAQIAAIDVAHGRYVRDRVIYDDRVFRVSRISVLGQIRKQDLVAGVDLIQLKPEDLRGDQQFTAWHKLERSPYVPNRGGEIPDLPPDDPPPTGGPIVHVHEQPTPAATWLIAHNLGHRPHVTLLNMAGQQVETDVYHLDENTVSIVWSEPTAGTALFT